MASRRQRALPQARRPLTPAQRGHPPAGHRHQRGTRRQCQGSEVSQGDQKAAAKHVQMPPALQSGRSSRFHSSVASAADGLELPYNIPAAKAYITPPDPRVQAKVPAIYIWPSDGTENRSSELGGTIPRNTGPGTASGTKGLLHQFDVYVTWFSSNSGTQADPKFPAIVDTVMLALRYSQPNPAQLTDPSTNLTSTIYNVGETHAVPHWGRSDSR